MTACRFALKAALLVALPHPSMAQLRLAPMISDGMVMQRQAIMPVWGWSHQGDTVIVEFDRQTYTAVSNSNGQWMVKFPPKAAGGPYEMVVTNKRGRIAVGNILIGDVWLCAGQSNMAWPVSMSRNARQEIAATDDRHIRHLQMSLPYMSNKPSGGPWTVADSTHVRHFTAVGYFFARELRKSIDVPIGLINVSVGGSRIEEWMSREALRRAGSDTSQRAVASRAPAALYHQLVSPLPPYPVKGILWYQGEANAEPGDNIKYGELFPRLIEDWRSAWGLGDLPFLFVQHPNFGSADTTPVPSSPLAVFRESQSSALRLANTAQVITIDLAEEDLPGHATGHPINKQDVGARLALAARKVAYGEKLEHSGPSYRRHSIQGTHIILEFDHVGHGLMIGRQGDELQGFAIAGADRRFTWATASIEKDRVVVWSKGVPRPIAVRYAWADNPNRANLYNQAGLPAAPFRTDRWPYKQSEASPQTP